MSSCQSNIATFMTLAYARLEDPTWAQNSTTSIVIKKLEVVESLG